MAEYSAALNEDANDVKTSAQYGDPGDGSNVWFGVHRIMDGGDVAQGDRSDAAVVDPTAAATVVGLLKGLLTQAVVSTTSVGSSAIANGSGNVANAVASATLVAGGAGKRTYVTKIVVTGAGATAASVVTVTCTGLTGGTRTWNLVIPAGATTSIVPLELDFGLGFPAAATNSPITVSVPAAGSGNTNLSVNVFGYVK